MKIKTLCLFTAAAAIAALILMDNWGNLQEVKVDLICVLAVVMGNLLCRDRMIKRENFKIESFIHNLA